MYEHAVWCSNAAQRLKPHWNRLSALLNLVPKVNQKPLAPFWFKTDNQISQVIMRFIVNTSCIEGPHFVMCWSWIVIPYLSILCVFQIMSWFLYDYMLQVEVSFPLHFLTCTYILIKRKRSWMSLILFYHNDIWII